MSASRPSGERSTQSRFVIRNNADSDSCHKPWVWNLRYAGLCLAAVAAASTATWFPMPDLAASFYTAPAALSPARTSTPGHRHTVRQAQGIVTLVRAGMEDDEDSRPTLTKRVRTIPPPPVNVESLVPQIKDDFRHDWEDGVREKLLQNAVADISQDATDYHRVAAACLALADEWPQSRGWRLDPSALARVQAELRPLSEAIINAASDMPPDVVAMSGLGIAKMVQRERIFKKELMDPWMLPAFQRVMHRAADEDVLNAMTASQATSVVWALARMRCTGDPLGPALVEHIESNGIVSDLDTKELATLTWSMAKLRIRHDAVLNSIGRRLAQPEILGDLDAVGIATVVWAFAKLGARRPVLMAIVGRRAVEPDVLEHFDVYGVINMLWSFATLKIRERSIIKPFAERLRQPEILDGKYVKITSWGLSRAAWAVATMRYKNPDLMATLAERATSPALLPTFDAQASTNLLWAYAALGIESPRLYRALEPQIANNLVTYGYSAETVSTLAWSAARMGYYSKDLMELLNWYILYTPGILGALTGQQIMKLLWAFARFKTEDMDLRDVVEPLVFQLTTRRLVETEKKRVVSLLAWSVGRLDYLDHTLMTMIKNRLLDKGPPLDSVFLSQAVWAFGRLKVKDHEFFQHVGFLIVQLKEQITSFSAANVLWAFSVSGTYHEPLLLAMANRLRIVMRDVTPIGIGRITWAYANLQYYDADLMLRLAQHALQPEILHNMDAQTMADVIWCYAFFDVRHPELIEALENEMLERPEVLAMHPLSLAKVVWSLARWETKNSRLMEMLAQRVLHTDTLLIMNAEGLANIAWAYAQLDIVNEPLMRALAKNILKPAVVLTLKPATISKIAVAYASIRFQHPQLIQALCEKAVKWASASDNFAFSLDEVAHLTWALATLNARDEFLMLLLASRLSEVEVLSEMNLNTLTSIAWAYGKLGVDPRFMLTLDYRALQPDIVESLSKEMVWNMGMENQRAGIRNKSLLKALEQAINSESLYTSGHSLAAIAYNQGWEDVMAEMPAEQGEGDGAQGGEAEAQVA